MKTTFSYLNKVKYVHSKNLKQQRKFQDAHKKPELSFYQNNAISDLKSLFLLGEGLFEDAQK